MPMPRRREADESPDVRLAARQAECLPDRAAILIIRDRQAEHPESAAPGWDVDPCYRIDPMMKPIPARPITTVGVPSELASSGEALTCRLMWGIDDYQTRGTRRCRVR
jgi:hypothetical protein